MYLFTLRQILERHPEIPALEACLIKLQSMQNIKPDEHEALHRREALEVYIAGRFRESIADSSSWKAFALPFINDDQLRLAQRVVALHPVTSKTELSQATSVVQSFLEKQLSNDALAKRVSNERMDFASDDPLLFITTCFILMMSLPILLAAFFFRGGIALLLLGTAVVNKNGMRASRCRIVWRSVVAASPCLVVFLYWFLGHLLFHGLLYNRLAFFGLVIILLIVITWSALLQERSIPDRLTGTRLVPR
jgi:hypothetical protein